MHHARRVSPHVHHARRLAARAPCRVRLEALTGYLLGARSPRVVEHEVAGGESLEHDDVTEHAHQAHHAAVAELLVGQLVAVQRL